MHKDRVYVPAVGDIRKMVLKEMHDVPYGGHLCYKKNINSKETLLLASDEE